MTDSALPKSIDEYIAAAAAEAQPILAKIRATVRKAAPGVEEKISYRMPAFTLGGRILLYFAAFKQHIGIYPPINGDADLNAELAPYRGEKGNLRFPLDAPIPYPLIGRTAKFRASQLAEPPKPKRRKP